MNKIPEARRTWWQLGLHRSTVAATSAASLNTPAASRFGLDVAGPRTHAGTGQTGLQRLLSQTAEPLALVEQGTKAWT